MCRMTSKVAAAPCAVVMRKKRVVAVKKVAAASASVRSIALPAVAGELEVRPESACGEQIAAPPPLAAL